MKKLLIVTILALVSVIGVKNANAQVVSLAEADTLVAQAERMASKGSVANSMPMLKRAKLAYESMNRTNSAEYGRCLHQLSYGYFMLDSLQLGLQYAQQAAEVRKQALGDTHEDYLMTMNNIGTYYFLTQNFRQSEKVYREILSCCMKRDRVPLKYSFFSTNAAWVMLKQGKSTEAKQVLDSTIMLVRRDYADSAKVMGDAAHDCANVVLAFDDYCQATVYMETALQVYEKFSEGYEQMLEKLGIIYLSREMCYDIDKAMRISNLTNEHNEYELKKPCENISCQTKRAEYYASIDKLDEAKSTYTKALKTKGSLQEQRDLKISFARFQSNQKMHQDAALYYRLAAADEKQLNGETKLYASSLYMAGLLYNISQKTTDAVQALRTSSAVYAKLGGDENLQKSYKCLQSVGAAYSIARNFDSAMVYYIQAMNGMSRWSQSEGYASALSDVAKTECNMGYFDSSLAHYRIALQIYENLQMRNEYTQTLQMIQYTLTKAGRGEESEQMNEAVNSNIIKQTEAILAEELASLPMYRSVWGEDGYQYAQTLGSIAEMEYNLGKYKEGTKHYSLFVPSIRASFEQMFTVMNASERAALWNEAKNSLSQLTTNIYDFPETDTLPDPEMCRLAYDAALLSKGILLNSSIEFMRILEDNGNKKAIELYQRIERNTEEMLTLQTSAVGNDADSQLLGMIREKKEETAQLEQRLRNECPELDDYTKYLSYTWKDVQHALGKKDIAIELVDVGEGVSYDHYIVALVVTNDCDAPMAIPLCKRLMLQKWFRMSSGRIFDQNDKGMDFWAPLLPLFEGKEHIYFSPEAEIHQLAVEYLKVDGVSLFDKYPLYRVSSTKELCKAPRKHKNQKMALFGDIAYQAEATDKRGSRIEESTDTKNLGRLDNTKTEIENIAGIYKKKARIDAYSQDRATELAFRRLSGKGVTMLHVASHGLYVAPNRATEQEAMRGSLLAFCGYNIMGTDSTNDGRVTAEDVSKMNLRDCEMVVLSACKTGLGEKGSDGIFGLQRGFKNAGVGTIVMSLRNVHDEATAQLMTAFYRELAAGSSKREALKKAMSEIRSIDKYKKAEYWASFILLDALD